MTSSDTDRGAIVDKGAKLGLIGVQSLPLGSDRDYVILTTLSGEIEGILPPASGAGGG